MIAASLLQSSLLQQLDLHRFDLQSFARLMSARMLNCTAGGIGIALLAWVLLRGLERQNSGTRFAVWFSALLGIAALPLVGHLGQIGSGTTEITRPSGIVMPASWALYIFASWAVVAAAGLIRIGVGFWHLRQLRKTCVQVDPATLDPLLQKTLAEFDSESGPNFNSTRPVAVCTSDRLRVPTAIGFIKPLVVIPSWAMRELSAVELNAILLHELAHLRRWDDWTNLVQKIVGALLFFHPAVWWIEKKLSLEREMACDDLVLVKAASPKVYAECLVSLAEKSLLRRGLALAQAAVGRVRHMSLRIAQIMDDKRPRATRVWRPAPVLLTGMSLACLMVFSDAPRLVSFKDASFTSASFEATAPETTANIASGINHTGQFMGDERAGMGSHVVPAKFVVPSGSVKAGATGHNAAAVGSAVKASEVQTKLPQRRMNQLRVVRTSFTENALAPQTLIFVMQSEVMQSEQYGDSGSMVWNISVWRLTVFSSTRNQAKQVTVSKQT
jgi:Zn-dependent protease with chaperone function